MSDQPTEETPQPSPSLSDVLSDLVDEVEMNEHGELEVQLADADVEEKSGDGDSDTEDAPEVSGLDTPAPDAEGDSQTPPDDGGWEDRYRNLQSHKDKQLNEAYGLVQELREELAHTRGQQSVAPKPDEKDSSTEGSNDLVAELLDGDVKGLDALIEKRVEERLAERLGSVDLDTVAEAMEDRELALELQAAKADHDDFEQVAPYMQQVFDAFPDRELSFEEAYQFVKANPQLTTAVPPAAPAPPEPDTPPEQPDAEAVRRARIEKAERLRRPVSAHTDESINDKPAHADSISDAIHGAIDEVYSG